MTPTPPSRPSTDIKVALSDLLVELQRENTRLQRLVSELLLKNQILRSDS
jgi:hypothetical protein